MTGACLLPFLHHTTELMVLRMVMAQNFARGKERAGENVLNLALIYLYNLRSSLTSCWVRFGPEKATPPRLPRVNKICFYLGCEHDS